ncbi:uroporphyrinogen-III synthase [Caldimonas brevitalea]|uniref:Uroporphyrinogen-III synthase n=1 Tax=Caldimonas brevitalea TaxID=413882 RepID=A0A0G3BX41_9BURK|nr:uroporphyrinogen-III synthase [Caldimonas brevitalea]AKJ31105.1 uroporphyrinogen-III synthase [Caldimonas brevitalea]
MKVLVTRPAAQARQWVEQLRARGVDAVALPLIGITSADDVEAVRAAWHQLHGYRAVVFVSPNAAEHFFAVRPEGAQWPDTVLAATPGPGTDGALQSAGVPAANRCRPAEDAPQFDSESLWVELGRHSWQGARVLIVRGEGGRNWLADQLTSAGAEVRFLSAYRRRPPQLDAEQERLLHAAVVDAPQQHLWFFSSSEAIDHLEACCTARALPTRWADSRALATHPRIAERARALGCQAVIEVRPALDAVVAGIDRSIQSFAL